MPRSQAEVIASVQLESHASMLELLATKKETEALRIDLKKDIELLRYELVAKIEGIKSDMLKWIIPLMLGQVGLTVALLKLI